MISQKKRAVAFDDYIEVEEQTKFEDTEEMFNPSSGNELSSITDADEEKIDEGKLISDSINQNVSSFNPDIMIEQMIQNFSLAKSIYGDSILRRISGFDANYLKKNIQIPEFRKELKEKMQGKIELLKHDDLLDEKGEITEEGYELASYALYLEELENTRPRGILGEKIHKKIFAYGDKNSERKYKRGDKFKDISLKKSIRSAIRKKHSTLGEDDLVVQDRESKGKVYVVYALDASGSMKGKKIELCKKAGIALAYNAINEKDSVGLLVFGTKVKEQIMPTTDFKLLLKAITKVRASMQTNIAETILKAIDMFPNANATKHLILLTDALPTFGKQPEQDTIEAVSIARNSGVTLSLIGISLDAEGEKFGKKLAETGEGRFYVVKNVDELDTIVLEDYYAIM